MLSCMKKLGAAKDDVGCLRVETQRRGPAPAGPAGAADDRPRQHSRRGHRALPAAGWRSLWNLGLCVGARRDCRALAATIGREPSSLRRADLLLEALRFRSDALEATFSRRASAASLLEGVRLSRPQRARRVRLRLFARARAMSCLGARRRATSTRGSRIRREGSSTRRRRRRAIDIDASIAREIGEETGLDAAALTRVPGYRVTLAGPLVSIAAEFCSDRRAPNSPRPSAPTSPPTASPSSPRSS